MNDYIRKRIITEADEIIKTHKTLRELEKDFSISKSTIHKDMQQRLIKVDYDRYILVKDIFLQHIKTRHIKGGLSTKKKYELIR